MGIQGGAVLSKIANHGLDFGIGAICASIETLTLYGAGKYHNSQSAKEKFLKYTLIATAIFAAIGTTFAGSIALGGTLLQVYGIQTAQWATFSSAPFFVAAHIKAFMNFLSKENLTS